MSLNKNQQKQFNMVCERIAGGESLRTICKDKDLPTARGVLKWLNADGNDAAVQTRPFSSTRRRARSRRTITRKR